MADYTRFQLRGDTRANWLSVNPILALNEPAIETDTNRFKIGDGVSTYSQLSYGRNTVEYSSLYNVTSLFPLPSGFYEHSTAILAIPSGERTLGLIITYETASGVWYTERFIGTDVANWVTLSNWEKLPDAGDLAQLRSDLNEIETIVEQVKDGGLEDGSIELPKLSPTLAAYIGSGGEVTNQADDDDLENTIINGVPVIREKTTKTYNPETYSGIGRVILRKNMVGSVNVLTQSMVNQANTVYEIRYDFDLNGAEITIPGGCVLDFQGGAINNGTIIGNYTIIKSLSVTIFNSIQFSGNFSNFVWEVQWFGAKGNNNQDDTESIQKAIDAASLIGMPTKVYLSQGTYNISKPILIHRAKNGRQNIELYGDKLNTIIFAIKDMEAMITTDDLSIGDYISSYIHDLYLNGNRYEGTFDLISNTSKCYAKRGIYFPQGFIYSKLHDVNIRNTDGWAIDISEIYRVNLTELNIMYCFGGIFLNENVNGVSITHNEIAHINHIGICARATHEVSVKDNVFENIGTSALLFGGVVAPALISTNYFENCSVKGINLSTSIDNSFICNPFIVITGKTNIVFYTLENMYNIDISSYSQVDISNNDFQLSENECCIFANALNKSIIRNNTTNNSVSPILGVILDNSHSIMSDVSISNNFYFKRYPIERGYSPKIKVYYTSNDSTYYSLINFTSEDSINTGYHSNIAKYLHFRTYGSKPLYELAEKYKGESVFGGTNESVTLQILTKDTINENEVINYLDEEFFSNYIYECVYWKYTESTNKWNAVFLNLVNSPVVHITIKPSEKITMPKIYIVGEKRNEDSSYSPMCKGSQNRVNRTVGIYYLTTTPIKVIGNPLVTEFVQTYDSAGAFKSVNITKGIPIVENINEYYNQFTYYKNEYVGLTLIDSISKEMKRWDGVSWKVLYLALL